MAPRAAKATLISASERENATDADAEFLEYNADLNYDADTEEALQKLRDSFAGTDTKGTMWVYRLPMDERGEIIGNAKPTMLLNAPLDRYELEELSSKLTREYMKPGERAIFRITATVRGSQGMKLNRLLILQRENVSEESRESARSDSIADMLRVIQEGQAAADARTERLFAALAQRQATPPQDAMNQTLAMVAAITGLTQSLVRQSAAPVTGSAPVDPMGQLESTMRVMQRMRGFFAQDGSGGGDDTDPDSLAGILKAGAPYLQTLNTLLSRAAPVPALAGPVPRRRRAPVAPSVSSVASASPASASVAPHNPAEVTMFAQLRPQFEALTQMAKEGSSAKDVAPLVIEQIPEGSPIEQHFLAFLEGPTWWNSICAIYPPAKDHAPWFKELRDAILAEFPEEGEGTGAAT